MSRRAQGTLLRSSRDDANDLAVAKLVLANPEKHPVCTVRWAETVLARTEHGQQRLPLEVNV